MARKNKNGRGGARPGAGRKPKPAADRLSKRVAVSFTEEEHERLEKAAGDEPVGTFLRRIILRYLGRRRE